MPVPRIVHRSIVSFDGTRIAYQVRGEGRAIVLANGLGGSYTAWRHQYSLFDQGYKVICWDYRGLYRSDRPARLDTLALEQQTRDLEAILAAESVDKAIFIGWSMGVQFNFEYFRRRPEQFLGLVALNGVAGKPFETALGIPAMETLLPPLLMAVKSTASLIGPAAGILAKWRGLIPTMQLMGMVGKSLDREVFYDLAGEFSSLDFAVYAEVFRYLGQHDARDLLHRIDVPVLVLTGSKDMMTPRKTSEAIRDAIPFAELAIIEGGTHYTAVEFPRQVNQLLSEFVARLPVA